MATFAQFTKPSYLRHTGLTLIAIGVAIGGTLIVTLVGIWVAVAHIPAAIELNDLVRTAMKTWLLIHGGPMNENPDGHAD